MTVVNLIILIILHDETAMLNDFTNDWALQYKLWHDFSSRY